MPNPWVIIAVIVAFLAFGTGAYFKGRHDMDLVYKAAALKAEKKVVADVVRADAITEAVGEKTATDVAAVRETAKAIVKWRTKYVNQKDDAACSIPNGFVVVHDAAASGTPLSDPTGRSDDRPSGVALTEATDVIDDNYGTCREIRAKYIGLRDWVRQQRADWSK